MKATATRPLHPAYLYCGLALFGSWLPWVVLIILQKDIFSMPWFFLYGLGAIVPSGLGLGLSFREGGSARLRGLLRTTLQVKYRLAGYQVIFLLIPGVNVAALLCGQTLGGPAPDFSAVGSYLAKPAALLGLIGMTLCIGPFNEEYGWCGYALPWFKEKWGMAAGTLGLGILRAAWHLPMFLMVGTDQSSRPLLPFFLGIVGLNALCAWLYESSGRKMSSALLAHFMYNLSIGTLLPVNPTAYWVRGWIYLAITLVLLYFWRKQPK